MAISCMHYDFNAYGKINQMQNAATLKSFTLFILLPVSTLSDLTDVIAQTANNMAIKIATNLNSILVGQFFYTND